jgi:ligand-binding sensor domain-containing protein
MKPWLLSLCIGLSTWLSAQQVLPLGSWRTHFPQRVGRYVTQSPEQLFYALPQAIMILEKDELSPKFITKAEGLSNVDLRLIRYHAPTETLIIVYQNGVIDLLQDGKVTTVNSIRNFTNITGEKVVNDIFLYDEQTVFLAASYGVTAFRLDNVTLPFTTFMGEANVRSVAVFEGHLYAGTEEGIYRIELNNFNPSDFGNWEWLGPEQGFPADYSATALGVFNDALYLGLNEDLYRLEESGPVLFSDQVPELSPHYLTAEGTHLLAGFRCVGEGCGRGRILAFDAQGVEKVLTDGCLGITYNAIEDEQGRIWFGDEFGSFRFLSSVTDDGCNLFSFNSPYSDLVWDLEIVNNEVWLASGALTASRSPRFVDHGFSSFVEGQWATFNRYSTDIMNGNDPISRDDDLFDVIDVVVNEATAKVYAASFLEGLLEYDQATGDISLIDEMNSPLQKANGDTFRTRVSGLAVDEEGNLWVSNHRALNGQALHRRAADGTWRSFSQLCGRDELVNIAIDLANNKWIIEGNPQSGLLLFNEGNIDDPNDDQCRVFTSTNSELPTNETNCIAVDLDGDVWVGTATGIVIFECGADPFNENCRGTLRIVERDGFLEFLFKTQSVQAIAVDGANRKWVGTGSGAYLLSPDGEEEILHFTENNSPLPDDNIRTIAVNNETGEVFFGTDGGLVSYQGDAVTGRRFASDNVLVFPNPVRPEYEGPITIRGLQRDANVKITDINGKLVYETQALGGQAIWDGRDYNGRRAQTGVYLVFSSTNPRLGALRNPETAVAKIVFVN